MGCVRTLLWRSVHRELSLGQLVASLYAVIHWACVQYRWCCVSLEKKAHLGRPLVWGLVSPITLYIELQLE